MCLDQLPLEIKSQILYYLASDNFQAAKELYDRIVIR